MRVVSVNKFKKFISVLVIFKAHWIKNQITVRLKLVNKLQNIKKPTQNRKQPNAKLINSLISVKRISGNHNFEGTDLHLFKTDIYVS